MVLPNPFRLVWSYIFHYVGHIRGFQTLADSTTQLQRDNICLPCSFYENGLCQKCGCLVIAKTSLALEKCPIGKWGRVWKRKKVVGKPEKHTIS